MSDTVHFSPAPAAPASHSGSPGSPTAVRPAWSAELLTRGGALLTSFALPVGPLPDAFAGAGPDSRRLVFRRSDDRTLASEGALADVSELDLHHSTAMRQDAPLTRPRCARSFSVLAAAPGRDPHDPAAVACRTCYGGGAS